MAYNLSTFELVKGAKAEGLRSRWQHMKPCDSGRGLFVIYDRPSEIKWEIYEHDCEDTRRLLGGWGQSLSGNTRTFSYSFLFEKNGVKYLAMITKAHNYYCTFEESL